ncbi:MAG: DUF368 domain-containing protein [Parvibaculum sp.]|nr:DUF368 domain-containing protein [Parvibaculum sp.]
MKPNEGLDDFPLSKNWHWKPLLGWSTAALALFASWLLPATRSFWDKFDLTVFRAINGTVAWGDPFAVFWALTGGRQFDIFSALMILAIYLYYIGRGDIARFRRGFAFGIVITVLLFVVVLLQRQIIGYPRLSPSLSLDTYHSIRAFVPWSIAKEGSNSSFPGDHATVTMIFALFWWRVFGWRLGLTGVGLLVFFAAPRLAAGAHWATDVVIGGGSVTLVMVALVSGTPVAWALYKPSLRITDRMLAIWDTLVEAISPGRRAEIDPVRQVLRGMCIGAADLVPGVSGGTMALILGIYKRAINAVAHVDRELLVFIGRREFLAAARHIDLLFTFPLALGAVLSLIIFSRIIPLPLLITALPEPTFGFFFGLIAASIIGLLSHVGARTIGSWAWIGLGVLLGIAAATLVPVETPDAGWFIFLCGMVAVAAMLVPGISGAFVLLILGKYSHAIEALGRFDLSFLLPLGAGAIAGAIAFSRAISWLLDRFYRQTILTVIGVLGGSLLAVWPFKDREYRMIGEKVRLVASHSYFPTHIDTMVVTGFAAMLAGIVLYRLLDRLAQHAEADEASLPADSHQDSRQDSR